MGCNRAHQCCCICPSVRPSVCNIITSILGVLQSYSSLAGLTWTVSFARLDADSMDIFWCFSNDPFSVLFCFFFLAVCINSQSTFGIIMKLTFEQICFSVDKMKFQIGLLIRSLHIDWNRFPFFMQCQRKKQHFLHMGWVQCSKTQKKKLNMLHVGHKKLGLV